MKKAKERWLLRMAGTRWAKKIADLWTQKCGFFDDNFAI
jgi:hypothetical protein